MKNVHLNTFPEPKENEQIAKVIGLKGANMCEIEYANKSTSICVIPTKFRKLIWIKKGEINLQPHLFLISKIYSQKGQFLIVRVPQTTDLRAQSMVEAVLSKDQIVHLKENNLWPAEFEDLSSLESEDYKSPSLQPRKENFGENDREESDEEDSEEDDFMSNPNHRQYREDSSDEEEEGEDESEDDE